MANSIIPKSLASDVTPSNVLTDFTVKNGTIVSGGYIKIGRLVVFNARIQMTAALAEYNYLISGLPTPYTQGSDTTIGTISNSSKLNISLTSNGGMFLGGGASVQSGNYLALSACYVSAS